MKEFFKKLWETIKSFVSSVWKKIVELLLSIPVTKYIYFIAGLIICAFFCIVIPGAIEWPAFPIIMLAAIVCLIRIMMDKNPKWINALAFSIGVIVIQILAWL